MNRLLTLLIVSTLALPAFATDDACWDRDMERLDTYGNPPSRGDNNFFTFTVSGTANVTMLYPGTKTMRGLPLSLYEYWTGAGLDSAVDPGMVNTYTSVAQGSGRGCTSTTLNNFKYFMPGNAAPPAASSTYANTLYDNLKRYPEPETTYSGGGGLNDNFEATSYTCGCKGNVTICPKTNCPTDGTGGKAWQYMLWPANDSGTTHAFTGTDTGSIDSECASATGSTSSLDYQDCQFCVRNNGYWLNYLKLATNPADTSPGVMVAKGNWLNFAPPKWAMLRLAYKRLVNGPLLNSLREGIVTNCNGVTGDPANCGGAKGEYRLQKMLPQACNGAGRPSQRIASVDPVKYNATSNPLAEMLFNVAWTVGSNNISSPPATWTFFSNQATHPSSEPGVSGQVNAKDGFCPGCNNGFSIVFTDGRGIDGWKNCSRSPTDLTPLPAYCKDASGASYNSYSACDDTASASGVHLGNENDGDDYLNPNLTGGAGALISGLTVRNTPTNTCTNDLVDDVASWMYRNNMYPPQPGTNLKLYGVEIGSNVFGQMNAVNAAALAGGGRAIAAVNFKDLEAAINSVFTEIITTATSFSVAAITTVQTRGTTFAFIPRFRPLLGSQWEGRLYRFRLFNEFSSGCSTVDLTCDGGFCKDALNPNGNQSCNDLYLQEWAPPGRDGSFVGEDDAGNFVLLDTNQPYTDAGWPLKTPVVNARPVWEAAQILECREDAYLGGSASNCDDGGTPIAARNIMTVGIDAGMPTTPTALIRFNDFSDAGIATMTNYMKFGGVNSDFCQSMALATRTSYTTKEDCGRHVMKFLEGKDVLAQNPDGGLVRPNILGDIFHSSPVLVTPPVPPSLCRSGVVNQCVLTLFDETGGCGDSSHGGACTPNSDSAYATYLANNAQRQELILVGANDGMLHAFQAGTYHADAGHDEGTGVEVWAFIPPDMMPKLQRYVMGGSHQVLVDGSPWVRDIWKDGSGSSTANNRKEPDEFHTIAIVGERGGGRHYSALDITDTNAPDGGAGGPRFLWTWPPIGSPEEMVGGETWNDLTPSAPPIGPVLMADPSGPISVPVGGTNVRARERWVVVLSGGYDPNLIRGRAIYVLDAWTGEVLYRFSRYDTSTTSDPRYQLGPVAAPIAMVDSNRDNFFDMAVVGDTEGKVWTLDMLSPFGTPSSPNWYGGLTFRQSPGTSGNLSDRSPFFTIASATLLDARKAAPGEVRVFLGSGDRDQIRVRDTDTADGGTCQVDNLRGCIRNNCAVDVTQQTFTMGQGSTAMTFTGEWMYDGGSSLAINSFTLGTNDAGVGDCSDPAQLNVRYKVTCPGNATMMDLGDGGTTVINSVYCDFDGGNDAGEECPDTSGKPLGASVAFSQQTVTHSRFYSLKPFDVPTFTNRPRMTSTASQDTYNGHTLTDADLVNADVVDGGMPRSAPGWYVVHQQDDNEKTASAALLLGGCVAWNTMVPENTFNPDAGQVCGGGHIPPSTAYLYQADDATGVTQSGLPGSPTQAATVRYQARVIRDSVPPQPTPVVSLNAKTGQAAYSGVSLEPGSNIPLQLGVGTAAVAGDIGWLGVSRNLHNCRHPVDGGVPVCN